MNENKFWKRKYDSMWFEKKIEMMSKLNEQEEIEEIDRLFNQLIGENCE